MFHDNSIFNCSGIYAGGVNISIFNNRVFSRISNEVYSVQVYGSDIIVSNNIQNQEIY